MADTQTETRTVVRVLRTCGIVAGGGLALWAVYRATVWFDEWVTAHESVFTFALLFVGGLLAVALVGAIIRGAWDMAKEDDNA